MSSWRDILNPIEGQDSDATGPPQRYPSAGQPGELVLSPFTTAATGSGSSRHSGEDVPMPDAPGMVGSPRSTPTPRVDGDLLALSTSRGSSSVDHATSSADSRRDGREGSPSSEIICYGMIVRIDAKLIGNMSEIDRQLLASAGPSGPPSIQRFTVTRQEPGHVQLGFTNGLKFGQLRQKDSKNLERLMGDGQLQVELEAVGATRTLRETIGKAKTNQDAMVQVSINVYGPRNQADDVGERLSDAKMFLQPPDNSRPVPYDNPHILKFPDLETATDVAREVVGGSSGRTRAEKSSENVQEYLNTDVFPELRRNDKLSGHDTGDTQAIKTKLLEHQRKAIDFMTQRETGRIDSQFLLWEEAKSREGDDIFRHTITGDESSTRLDERGGGILADEMGMGKSLSIIALVMKRATYGRDWANIENSNGDGHGQIARHTKATLVVASSALIINTWESEIQEHLRDPKGITIIRYHGPREAFKIADLEAADIVITTYNTLATEFADGIQNSLLHRVKWYRVVLDEAHYIRRQATTFHKACHDLEAESRWCLTGTPIQNRLDDIGALFAFIRIKPFHSLNQFRKYITNPYESHTFRKDATNALVALMDSLCLRRTRDEALDLPEPTQIKRALEFTQEERVQYEKTEEILKRIMHQRVNEYERYHWEGSGAVSSGSSYHGSSAQFGLFQVNLQLRILCNHGTFQQPFSWQRRSRRDLREAETADPQTAGSSELFCSGCGILLPVGADCKVSPKCAHLLCPECYSNSSMAARAAGSSGGACPLCSVYGRLGVDGDGDEEDDDDHYFRREGVSTKMRELVKDVMDGLEGSKSIIFSCWTRTLSLVARHLDLHGIEYERIDGMCSLTDRQKKLNDFADKDGKPVLIMTTGTGAFGLNLTTANRVFIVELQWNPSVENQAISRAIRLGQKEKVTVTRYYVKNTVEQQMMDQQKRKRDLASIGNASSREVIDDISQP